MNALTMPEVLARLEQILPVHEPQLWESLQPPATAEELGLLRQAVVPLEVPAEWIEFLCWHNGSGWSQRSWPLLEASPLSVRDTIEHYQALCEITEEWQWHRSWLPITHESWSQCGIELDADRRGLIVDGSFPDPPRCLAPSVVALLHAIAAVIEAGLQGEEPQRLPYAYVRVRQKEVTEPIYALYGTMPTDLEAT